MGFHGLAADIHDLAQQVRVYAGRSLAGLLDDLLDDDFPDDFLLDDLLDRNFLDDLLGHDRRDLDLFDHLLGDDGL